MRTIIALALAVVAGPALAQDLSDYRDDRSDPAAVVESFYNAVNRKEYARAYSYFGADQAPQPYDEFASGYEETETVIVATGQWTEDHAMSHSYFALPVVIDAESTDGSHQLFAGCYRIALTSPGVQEPPVEPMHIESASLKPIKAGDIASAPMPECEI